MHQLATLIGGSVKRLGQAPFCVSMQQSHESLGQLGQDEPASIGSTALYRGSSWPSQIKAP